MAEYSCGPANALCTVFDMLLGKHRESEVVLVVAQAEALEEAERK